MLYAPMVMLSKVMPRQCIVGKLWNAFASSGPVVIHIDSSVLVCSDAGLDCVAATALQMVLHVERITLFGR